MTGFCLVRAGIKCTLWVRPESARHLLPSCVRTRQRDKTMKIEMLPVIVGLAAGFASAQTTVTVEPGEIITQTDLETGVFNGMGFELGPMTTIQINGVPTSPPSDPAGRGFLGAVGTPAVPGTIGTPFMPAVPFDFMGTTIDLQNGVTVESGVYSNVTIHVADNGRVGNSSVLESGTTVDLGSGTVGIFATIQPGATVNLSGNGLLAFAPAITGTVNMSGGGVDGPRVFEGGSLNLRVRGATLDGESILLDVGRVTEIPERDGNTLETILENGDPQTLNLSGVPVAANEVYLPGSRVTLELVPGDCPVAFNNDNTLDIFDLVAFLREFDGDGEFADFDSNGTLESGDITGFVTALEDPIVCP